MKRRLFVTMTITAFLELSSYQTKAQTAPPAELPKFEVAADFSSLSLDSGTNLPGLGGRFTYNLNKHVALEAAGYFFPGKCDTCVGTVTGRVTEGLFGVKVGKRFSKWGFFGKARPGLITASKGTFGVVSTNQFPLMNEFRRRTNFALDLGAVLEFYPSRRIVVRFDAGDTLIHYSRQTSNIVFFDPITHAPSLFTFTTPARTRHNFQFISGVGFRF